MTKESKGKTVWFSKEVISMVEDYRSSKRPIPSFSESINTILKKALTVTQKGNNKVKTERLIYSS